MPGLPGHKSPGLIEAWRRPRPIPARGTLPGHKSPGLIEAIQVLIARRRFMAAFRGIKAPASLKHRAYDGVGCILLPAFRGIKAPASLKHPGQVAGSTHWSDPSGA